MEFIAIAFVILVVFMLFFRANDNLEPKLEDMPCPVCGYYCLGKGGYGCIDKPKLIEDRVKRITT